MSKTINITFIQNGEKKTINVKLAEDPADNPSILEVAHSNGIALEGSCEGSLACSTCHVYIQEEFFNKLPEIKEEEDDMLDLAYGLAKTSRLGCQIKLTEELNGLEITIPDSSRNLG